MHNGEHDASGGHGKNKRLPIKMFPKVMCSLLRNAPFVFTMLAGATEGVLTSGFATFVPKYIQNKFGVTSSLAALYTGKLYDRVMYFVLCVPEILQYVMFRYLFFA